MIRLYHKRLHGLIFQIQNHFVPVKDPSKPYFHVFII